MTNAHSSAALQWLRRSFVATGRRGFSHSYTPILGWRKAYPETTGYIIETLLRYAEINRDESLRSLATSAADWLCAIQHSSGAYSGLLAGHPKPSVFNTAQILFGLTQTGRKQQALATRQWLLRILEPDGSWRQAAYVPGFTPSYYTRAVWGVLYSLKAWPDTEAKEAGRRAIHFYAGRMLPNGAVSDWGFHPGKPAFTHTIAYTLEGFLESAQLLGEQDILEKTLHSADQLAAVIGSNRRLAGRYDTDWRGDYSFHCLPGMAQCSVLFARLHTVTGLQRYRNLSAQLLDTLLPYQHLKGPAGICGAIPGSAPVWGPYMRFRYPNWGAKFLLDALSYH